MGVATEMYPSGYHEGGKKVNFTEFLASPIYIVHY